MAIVNRLKDIQIKQAKPKDKDYFLNDGGGLRIAIKTNGNKVWEFRYTFNQKRRVTTFKSYDIMYITTQGGPGESTKVLAYHIFNQAFVNSKFGYASAVSMVLLVIILCATFIQFRFENKFTGNV